MKEYIVAKNGKIRGERPRAGTTEQLRVVEPPTEQP